MPSYHPYDESGIVTILIQSSFLLLLNVISWILDKLLYCGLVGQILIGIVWGSPGAQLLTISTEDVVNQLGYLGLLLIVYEGGLSIAFPSLKANLVLSAAVATTGIIFPIGLSFLLQYLAYGTALQSFAAGAALCSTSLGTTFTVLRSSDLSQTRMGVILTIAAMMDDVVGLVMVQVISNLGNATSGFNASTVVRPVLVSVAFVVILPLICRFLLCPIAVYLNRYRASYPDYRMTKILNRGETALVLHTILLISLISGASYAGTSNLFAAYLAGAVISWWDSEAPHINIALAMVNNDCSVAIPGSSRLGGGRERNDHNSIEILSPDTQLNRPATATTTCSQTQPDNSGITIYKRYYNEPVERLLRPLFFASIGFSIPISNMFAGSILWRGIIYSILMTFGKMMCGLWLVRFKIKPTYKFRRVFRLLRKIPILRLCFENRQSTQTGNNVALSTSTPEDHKAIRAIVSSPMVVSRAEDAPAARQLKIIESEPEKPLSLYPAAIISFAMVARGEVGFLIAALAQSRGIFNLESPSKSQPDIFLIVIWAIFLCTMIGPFCVGLLVRRVRYMEKDSQSRNSDEGLKHALGVWM